MPHEYCTRRIRAGGNLYDFPYGAVLWVPAGAGTTAFVFGLCDFGIEPAA
jgi:hypothetical protein